MRIARYLFVAFLSAACGSSATGGGDGDGGADDDVDAGEVIPPLETTCSEELGGTTYEVGEGQALAAVGDVPWHQLGPGDTVRIHARAEAYHEKIILGNRGTEDQPIRVCGVPDGQGRRPVIDGADATTSSTVHFIDYVPLQDDSLVLVGRDGDDEYGERPGYILIEGIEIRGARPGNFYTTSDGERREYDAFASALNVNAVDHLVVRDCVLTDSGLGIFVMSKSEDIEGTLSRDILIEHNDIYGNGSVDRWTEHNAYIQAFGVIVQYNHFGRLRPGALGGNLKDRSVGVVIRYNWLEGAQRVIDLVDAQEHAQDALADPRYHETYVYGNVLENGPEDASNIVHYGGDTGEGFFQNYRKGTLYFYNNTILLDTDMNVSWTTALFELSTNDESLDFRNNVVMARGDSYLYLMRDAGNAEVGVNWISNGWEEGSDGFQGTVTGAGAVLSGSDPMLDTETLRPRAGSPVIDMAGPLAPGAAQYPVDREYAAGTGGADRQTSGAAPDLGAFEAAQ